MAPPRSSRSRLGCAARPGPTAAMRPPLIATSAPPSRPLAGSITRQLVRTRSNAPPFLPGDPSIAIAPALLGRVRLFPRVFEVRDRVELDILDLAVHLLRPPDVHVLDDVARLRI